MDRVDIKSVAKEFAKIQKQDCITLENMDNKHTNTFQFFVSVEN